MEEISNLTFPGRGSGHFSLDNSTMVSINLDEDAICRNSSGNGSSCPRPSLDLSIATPIIMFSSGLIGNALALVVLYTSSKEFKKSVFYTLMAGLAWTDLIGQLLVSPQAIIVYGNKFQWVGGQPTCIYHAFAMVCFGLLTPVLVCTMSIDRLMALKFSFFYARRFTKRKAQVTIVCCWIGSFFFCSLPLVGFGSYELQYPKSWCFLNFHRESSLDVAYAALFSILSLVFIAVNMVCNIIVVVQLIQMRRKRILSHSPSVERRSRSSSKSQKTRIDSEEHMVVFLCAITLVFSTCYLPFNVNILVNQIYRRTNRYMDLLGVRLVGINQILDPWLYILLRRSTVVKILKLIRDKIRNSSRALVHLKCSQSHEMKGQGKADKSTSGRKPLSDYDNVEDVCSTSGLLPEVYDTKLLNVNGTENQSHLFKRFSSAESEDSNVEYIPSIFIPSKYKHLMYARRVSCTDVHRPKNRPTLKRMNSTPVDVKKYLEELV